MIQIQVPMTSMTATAKLEPYGSDDSDDCCGGNATKKTGTAAFPAAFPSTDNTCRQQQQRPLLLSDVVMEQSEALLRATCNNNNNNKRSQTVNNHQNAAAAKTPVDTKLAKTKDNLWLIHGRAYDLDSFVERHPGGVEAILLGRGRDCTALVESYHAFSTQHWKVLEKYCVKTSPSAGKETVGITTTAAAAKASSTTAAVATIANDNEDFFYEILKQRVSAKLRSVGIDPVQDRGASPSRIAYYLTIITLWLYTGYMHLSVRIAVFLSEKC
jgi:cytochrome b involved in lipid metabolism